MNPIFWDFCWVVLGKNQLDKQKNPFQGLCTVDGLEIQRTKSMAAVEHLKTTYHHLGTREP